MGWGIIPFIYSRHNNKHMKQIIALVLLSTWMLLIIIMMGEPQMNDQVNESVGSGPQWIGWALVSFILFTPFIVIKLMDGKTK
jgi:hypothetical protein